MALIHLFLREIHILKLFIVEQFAVLISRSISVSVIATDSGHEVAVCKNTLSKVKSRLCFGIIYQNLNSCATQVDVFKVFLMIITSKV